MSTLKVSTIAPLGTDATNTVSLQAGAKTSGFGKIGQVVNSSKHFDSAVTNFIVTANGTGDYFQIYGYTEQSGGSTLQPTDSDSRLMWFCGQRIIGA